ncbi:MAG: hypothetical protein SPG80_12650 [Candidatus Ventricola sp.]|nr:hypothetical protein [Clostridiales bacterium]MDY5350368.1 hypothetical protein [Candidatus Ventricola sp.]
MGEIYNEQMEHIENPDLTLGYLKPGTRTEHHDAVEGVTEVWHYETVAEYPNGGKDIRKVVDVPGVEAQAAWDEVIPIQIYVLYTQEEFNRMEAERSKPTQEERITQLETTTDDIILMMADLIGGM